MPEPTPQAEVPKDLSLMSQPERMSFILDVRARVQADEEVSDEDIRNAVRLIRLSRADTSRGAKSTKKAAPKITLADF